MHFWILTGARVGTWVGARLGNMVGAKVGLKVGSSSPFVGFGVTGLDVGLEVGCGVVGGGGSLLGDL